VKFTIKFEENTQKSSILRVQIFTIFPKINGKVSNLIQAAPTQHLIAFEFQSLFVKHLESRCRVRLAISDHLW